MDLLIKDMELPKGCQNCKFKKYVGTRTVGTVTHALYECPFNDSLFTVPEDESILPSCRLVSVSESHGDLIDRKDIDKLEDKYCKPCSMEPYGISCACCILSDFLDEISELPTVVVAEEQE